MTAIHGALRVVCVSLIICVTTSSFGQTTAPVPTPMDATTLHQELLTRGIGKGVKVTEIDGTVVKGILMTIDPDSFQVTPKNAKQPTRILSTQVAKCSKDGLSKGAKIGIGIGIGVVALLVVSSILASRV